MITQELLKEYFDYKDGNLYWKKKVSNYSRITIGSVAGHKREDGYIRICFLYKLYLIHRLIFLYHHGYLPEFIDHIDNNRLNNKIENLREATKNQNAWNRLNSKRTSTGVKNVYWHSRDNKWFSVISVNKNRINLGYFNTKEEAKLAAEQARLKYHGEFANNG